MQTGPRKVLLKLMIPASALRQRNLAESSQYFSVRTFYGYSEFLGSIHCELS